MRVYEFLLSNEETVEINDIKIMKVDYIKYF